MKRALKTFLKQNQSQIDKLFCVLAGHLWILFSLFTVHISIQKSVWGSKLNIILVIINCTSISRKDFLGPFFGMSHSSVSPSLLILLLVSVLCEVYFILGVLEIKPCLNFELPPQPFPSPLVLGIELRACTSPLSYVPRPLSPFVVVIFLSKSCWVFQTGLKLLEFTILLPYTF